AGLEKFFLKTVLQTVSHSKQYDENKQCQRNGQPRKKSPKFITRNRRPYFPPAVYIKHFLLLYALKLYSYLIDFFVTDNHAVFEAHDSFAHVRNVVFVRYHQNRFSFVIDFLNQMHHFLRSFGIE